MRERVFMGLIDIRRGEARHLLGALLTLGGIVAAHTLMETARDAMFLADLPITRLPLAYLGIGAGALLLGGLPRQLSARIGARAALVATQLLGVLAAVLLWLTLTPQRRWLLFVQYIWTGSYATTAITAFWTTMGSVFMVTQGKRLFGLISAGASLGAIVGSGVGALWSRHHDVRHLLLAAALVQLGTLAGALLLPRLAPAPGVAAPLSLGCRLRMAGGSPYLRGIGGLALLAALTQILVEYQCKAMLARAIAAGRLGVVLSVISGVLAVVALLMQVLSGVIIKRSGATTALSVLPALLILGVAGLPLLGGLRFALGLKIIDGTLRNSLNRVGMELLYLPLTARVRDSAKPLIEGGLGRLGQAIGALLLLGLSALGLHSRALRLAIALCAAAWLLLTLWLHRPYRALLHGALDPRETGGRWQLPALDLGSLETLLRALHSSDDRHVILALEMLAAQGQQRIVPARLLQHPSAAVVRKALEVLAGAGDSAILRPLLQHPQAEVRSAAAHTLAALDAVAGGDMARLTQMMQGPPEQRVAVLAAVLPSGDERLLPMLPMLIDLLGVRALRDRLRRALLGFGERGLLALAAALADPGLDLAVRRHLPRTISQFASPQAVALLTQHLSTQPDGVVRFKILRGLGRLIAGHPELLGDRRPLQQQALATARQVSAYRGYGLLLQRHQQGDARLDTPKGRLLRELVQRKDRLGLERLFRLLAILHPRDSLIDVYGALSECDLRSRGIAFEALEDLLHGELRDWVLPLVDNLDEGAQLLRLPAVPRGYRDLLRTIAADGDQMLSQFSAAHEAELAQPLEEDDHEERDGAADVVRRASAAAHAGAREQPVAGEPAGGLVAGGERDHAQPALVGGGG